jgi:hypothetical protein
MAATQLLGHARDVQDREDHLNEYVVRIRRIQLNDLEPYFLAAEGPYRD